MLIRIGSQKFAHILSVYTKKPLAAGAPPQTALGRSRRSPRLPSRTPAARACGARPLRLVLSALVPNCGAQIMVNLIILD